MEAIIILENSQWRVIYVLHTTTHEQYKPFDNWGVNKSQFLSQEKDEEHLQSQDQEAKKRQLGQVLPDPSLHFAIQFWRNGKIYQFCSQWGKV